MQFFNIHNIIMNNSNKKTREKLKFSGLFYFILLEFPLRLFSIVQLLVKRGFYTPIYYLTILHFFSNFGTILTYKISKPLISNFYFAPAEHQKSRIDKILNFYSLSRWWSENQIFKELISVEIQSSSGRMFQNSKK